MVGTWMLYSVVVSVLLVLAGWLAERIVAGYGGAVRRVWALTLAAGVGVPLAAAVAGAGIDPLALEGGAVGPLAPVIEASLADADRSGLIDQWLLVVWALASAGVAAWTALGALRLARARRGWTPAVVDGVSVLMSDDVGPAVFGVVRPRIVFPKWAAESDAAARGLMLRHEREHVAGGDPRLLALGTALVALLPWNLPLWLMAHRLRLAVEVDCDRRVLRRGGCDPRTYGHLLLAVGARSSRPVVGAAAFSKPRSLLEHRLVRMTDRRAPAWRRSVVPLVGVVAAVAAIWAMPRPALGLHLPLEVCTGETAGTEWRPLTPPKGW